MKCKVHNPLCCYKSCYLHICGSLILVPNTNGICKFLIILVSTSLDGFRVMWDNEVLHVVVLLVRGG